MSSVKLVLVQPWCENTAEDPTGLQKQLPVFPQHYHLRCCVAALRLTPLSLEMPKVKVCTGVSVGGALETALNGAQVQSFLTSRYSRSRCQQVGHLSKGSTNSVAKVVSMIPSC